jgi:SM-20-related protein
MSEIWAQDETILSALADQLAAQGYACWDTFLQPAETQTLRALAHQQFGEGSFKAAGVGQGLDYQHNQAVRSDHILWLDHHNEHSPFAFFFNRLGALADYLNQTCYLGIRDLEMHLAVYPQGAFYKRHLDVFRHDSGRVLSAICYLNENWTEADGGQLRIYFPPQAEDQPETHIDLLPLGGRLVFFLSDQLEHEVLPARRNRYSITGWMKKATLF